MNILHKINELIYIFMCFFACSFFVLFVQCGSIVTEAKNNTAAEYKLNAENKLHAFTSLYGRANCNWALP